MNDSSAMDTAHTFKELENGQIQCIQCEEIVAKRHSMQPEWFIQELMDTHVNMHEEEGITIERTHGASKAKLRTVEHERDILRTRIIAHKRELEKLLPKIDTDERTVEILQFLISGRELDEDDTPMSVRNCPTHGNYDPKHHRHGEVCWCDDWLS